MRKNQIILGALIVGFLAAESLQARIFTQENARGTSETSDHFGRSLATGDFNGDGFADLAVGIPHKDIGGANDAGAVDIFYGSATGLSEASEHITQASIVTATSESGDRMGWSLAVGNFNGDSYDDLAVGIPYEDTDGASDTGMVAILFGSADGLLPSSTEAITQNSIITSTNENGDLMGWSLAVGNFNGDAYDDLAVGIPSEDADGAVHTGMVGILFGSAQGLLPSSTEAITQNSVTSSTNEDGDQFGYALAAGNFNGDAYDDLAVGVPFEDADGATDTGMVAILFGSANGLLPSNTEAITQNSLTASSNEDGDQLGRALAVGNFNGDAFDDLVIGAPFEDVLLNTDSGATYVMYGSASGLLPATSEGLNQGHAHDDDVAGDRAGYSLATGDFDADGFDDLIVGVPREDIVYSGNDVGGIQAFFGSDEGLLPHRSYWARPWSFGAAEEAGDEFGFTVAVGDFDNDGRDGVAVGIPFENLGSIADAGAVVVQEIDPALPNVRARAAVVMNRRTGEILGSKMPDQRLAMASTTKIMTALLAVEAIEKGDLSLDDVITVSANADPIPGSEMNGPGTRTLVAGDRLSLEDLLYGVLLPSGNNASVVVAEAVATTEAAFVERMNNRAAALGMTRTMFVNPHGLDPESLTVGCPNIDLSQSINLTDEGCGHYTTPRDLALLADFALDRPLFRTIVSTPQWMTSTWVASNGRPQNDVQSVTNRLIRNTPPLVSPNRYRGAYGVKTGTTANAAECLVSAAERCGVDLVAVVLGSDDDSNSRYPDTRAILDFAFSRAIQVPESLPLAFTESFETDGVGCRHFVPGIADSPADVSDGRYLGIVNASSTLFNGGEGSSIFAVQDIPDNGQGDGQGTVTIVPFDLSGFHSISVSLRVAAAPASAFDPDDGIFLETRFGESAWSLLGAFRADGGPGGSRLLEDTDLDGVGDGAVLDNTLRNFSWNKRVAGSSRLQLRVRFQNFDAADERGAVDYLRVAGVDSDGITVGDWALINDLTRVSTEVDTDGNGIVDRLEFLFNQDPRDPHDQGNLPRMVHGPNGRIQFEFSRIKTGSGALILQNSSSLASDSWRNAQELFDYRVLSVRTNPIDPLQEDVVFQILPRAEEERMYFRLSGE